MTRLVDADALKKAISNEFIKYADSIPDNWDAFNEGLAHACMLIDNAPTACSDSLYEAYCKLNDAEFEHTESFTVKTPKGKIVKFEKARQGGGWIPVSERLPEEEGRYIITTDYGDVTIDSFVDGIFILNLGNVIAWQPLPEPYEGGKNDSDSSTEDIT